MRVKEGNKEQDILESAIRVFARDGYHSAKVSTIADGASVATGSVYQYFSNKEDILQKIVGDLWHQLINELQSVVQRGDKTPAEKLDSMIDVIFNAFIHNPSLAIVFVNGQNHLIQNGKRMDPSDYYRDFLDLGEQVIVEGIEKQVFTAGIDIKVLREFIFGGVRHMLHRWAQDVKAVSLDHIRQEVKAFIKRGFLIDLPPSAALRDDQAAVS